MENYRLKVAISGHAFEAEGPPADVKEQFRDFKELVALALANPQPAPPTVPSGSGIAALTLQATGTGESPQKTDSSAVDASLAKIMRVDGRVVSLTIRAPSVEGAILLVLYGQKVLRQNESISGGEMLDGLKATGGLGVGRIDRLLEKAGAEGDVIVSGERRAKRYRLTNAGLTKARQIATDLIAIVA